MMKRAIGVAAVALLALSLPLGGVAAKGSNGHGPPSRIQVCHKATGAHPVTITISSAAWKAHEAHGDRQGPCPTTPTKPAPAQNTCTFDAATSSYYSGPASNPGSVYATGPIHFAWTVATGVVAVPGGYWNELSPPPPAASTTYYNLITAGSVSGTGSVSLSFVRTVPDSYSISFVGQLSGNTLSGSMGGIYYTASGQVTCTGSTQGTCTFDAATSSYYSGPASNPGTVVATGPIHFSWTVASGVVTVPGGYWTELYPLTAPSTYENLITAGSVSSGGAVSLSFTRTNQVPYSMSFGGTLTGGMLSGSMSGWTSGWTGSYYYTASGQVRCTG